MYNDDDDEIDSEKESEKEEIDYNEEDDEEDSIEEEEEGKVYEEEEEEDIEENYSEVNVALGNLIGRIKKNVLFMLHDRGIQLNEEEQILSNNYSFMDIFCKCMNNNETGFSREYNFEKGKIFVHIIIKNMRKKVCLKEIKEIFSKISKINSYILIVPDKLSFDANLEIQKYKNVEIFTYDFFLFSLPRHEYVPKHILLNENEKQRFLKKRNLCIEQLPLIRKSDPVIKYYGWQKGSIVQIQRPGWMVYRAIF
jgi:DNA-directed RNA polymerase I, II, and III subunit RPABC1